MAAALTASQLNEALHWRYATKAFDPAKKLSDAEFESLLDSARLAASSWGLQPWSFVVVKNAALREKLMGASWNQRQVVDASHLVVLCRQASLTVADVERFANHVMKVRGATAEQIDGYKQMMLGFVKSLSAEASAAWMEKQVYISLGTLLTAAATLGIDACPMEGFDRAKFDELLGLKGRGLASVVLCPVGRRSESDGYAKLKKVRYERKDVVVEV